jgi:hypothetical protein
LVVRTGLRLVCSIGQTYINGFAADVPRHSAHRFAPLVDSAAPLGVDICNVIACPIQQFGHVHHVGGITDADALCVMDHHGTVACDHHLTASLCNETRGTGGKTVNVASHGSRVVTQCIVNSNAVPNVSTWRVDT